MEAYEKKADQMERALKKSREKFVSEEDLKESSRGPLTKEIRSYETYISQDGERRNMIRGLTEKSRENIRFMEQLIEEAEEVIQYIDDWEPSDEEDDLDEEELWEPVIRHMSRYPVLTLGVFFWSKRQRKRGMVRENQINEWKRHF